MPQEICSPYRPFGSAGVETVPRIYIRAGRISSLRTSKTWLSTPLLVENYPNL